jgi:hypothetical protein
MKTDYSHGPKIPYLHTKQVQSNPDKCTKCVSIVRAHAITQRGYAVLRSEFSCWRVLKQLTRILCTYPYSTVLIVFKTDQATQNIVLRRYGILGPRLVFRARTTLDSSSLVKLGFR